MPITRPYSGFSLPSMIPGCSRNWRRTSWTTVPAERPTARIGESGEEEGDRAADEHAEERRRVGDVDLGGGLVEQRRPGGAQVELVADRLDERGEQGDGGEHRRGDGDPLGDRLRRVADGVEADHDTLGLAAELAGHLGDAGGVVRHRSEAVLADTTMPVVESSPMPVSATR